MPFPYYRKLPAAQRRVYERSNRTTEVRVPDPAALAPLLGPLRAALQADRRRDVERAAAMLVGALLRSLGVPPVDVEVLARRPRSRTSELHGLYTRESGKRPVLQVWMRTAAHRQPVAFRTFVRTLMHEVGHHLDYTLLQLRDSLHTEGFFRRESSLVRQIAGPARRRREGGDPVEGRRVDTRAATAVRSPAPEPTRRHEPARPAERRRGGAQLELPFGPPASRSGS